MSISAFPDRGQSPSAEQILAVVGSRRNLWQSIATLMLETYGAREELKYYGKSYGWMVQYRRAGKLLVSLYPKKNGLVAQIVLPEPQVEAILTQPIGEKARMAVESANRYAEGRWVYLDVWTEQEVDDVRQILLMKAPRSGKAARTARASEAICSQDQEHAVRAMKERK